MEDPVLYHFDDVGDIKISLDTIDAILDEEVEQSTSNVHNSPDDLWDKCCIQSQLVPNTEDKKSPDSLDLGRTMEASISASNLSRPFSWSPHASVATSNSRIRMGSTGPYEVPRNFANFHNVCSSSIIDCEKESLPLHSDSGIPLNTDWLRLSYSQIESCCSVMDGSIADAQVDSEISNCNFLDGLSNSSNQSRIIPDVSCAQHCTSVTSNIRFLPNGHTEHARGANLYPTSKTIDMFCDSIQHCKTPASLDLYNLRKSDLNMRTNDENSNFHFGSHHGTFVEESNLGINNRCLIDNSSEMLYPQPSVPVFDRVMDLMMDEKYSDQFLSESIGTNSDVDSGLGEQTLAVSLSNSHCIDTTTSKDVPYGEVNTLPRDISFKYETKKYQSPVSFDMDSSSAIEDGYHPIGSSKNLASKQLLGMASELGELESQSIVPVKMCDRYVKIMEGSYQSNPSRINIQTNNDADICILDDISDSRLPPLPLMYRKSLATSYNSSHNDSAYSWGNSGGKLMANDERLTYRIALQDLSQPKLEANPPADVLLVNLLRHQRIALSWMIQKETKSLNCCGGILADDQGLGKTVSTIALILTERPQSSKLKSLTTSSEVLNLDDEDVASNYDGNHDHDMRNKQPKKCDDDSAVLKGRPSAGTLIVCPISVLRQWEGEMHNKVSKEANLSILVYHGSNRTKDAFELAKYDVVLTTYSIVSMEVPPQPIVDKHEEDKPGTEIRDLDRGYSASRKRKYPNSSNGGKGKNGALIEFIARPLARVGWFRVVLDEAQSIKNYRTQVARACWGLRAKRRWCLSGTPIQNAVDDLYSYFRFLRYDPYAVYNSFCTKIKIPINKNPCNGYKKLQAVLQTIMLRRTKGTLIDGKPIINLPPKTVSLKKVDFSEDERIFYSRLEAESREQYQEYAAAGTVKQNYVNILLMLLRLRQACDHPLLVKHDSVSSSAIETVRKLPIESQNKLLHCLEDSLAICSICNDSPENAVVTTCGHVFCNQCICEHLTGDDKQCPEAKCKVQITATSVFSKSDLRSSIFGYSSQDSSPDSTNIFKTHQAGGSSKIRAALEILRSLVISYGSDSKSSLLPSVGLSSFSENPISQRDLCERMEDDQNVQPREKAIVFSQWTRMLDLLEIPLKSSGIQFRRLDGTMSVSDRDQAVKDFNAIPEVSVMIMSLKAASLGLNMVAACHVLLLDLWWNPTTEDQAIDRAHRIGQTRPVMVSRLTIRDTVEDRILALQEKKREMVSAAFGEDQTGGRQTRLTVDDLNYLFMA